MHNNLDPKKIEDLLRDLPKIEDTRSKDDVFARLKADGVFDEEESESKQEMVKPIKKRLPFFTIGSFVAVFALVIVTTLLMNKDEMFDTANEASIKSYMSKEDSAEQRDIGQAEDSQSADITSVARISDYRTALYADELVDEVVFTIGLTSNAAESLPVSMKIPTSFLSSHGLDANASYLQIYELVAPLLDEQAIGFYEFHPFVGKFEERGEQLIHYLPDEHSYDLASAAISNYFGVLDDTFGLHYKEVLLRNLDGEPVEFSEIGVMNEPVRLKGLDDGKMNYFVFEQGSGMRYLSPNFRETFNTVTDAFVALKEETNDIYKTAMIDGVDFTIENRETYVAIKFTQPLNVTDYEVDELMTMLEAMIATAASFGEQVKFENIVQEEWGGFRFTEVIPKLVGLNEIPFLLE